MFLVCYSSLLLIDGLPAGTKVSCCEMRSHIVRFHLVTALEVSEPLVEDSYVAAFDREAARLMSLFNNAAIVLSTLSLMPILLFDFGGLLRTLLITISFLLFGISIIAETAVKGVKKDWVTVMNSEKPGMRIHPDT
jgi:hypothetical protein